MEFKFIGQFTLLVGALYMEGYNYGPHDRRFVKQYPLCLRRLSDGTEGIVVSARYSGVPADKHFTVWETPMARPIGDRAAIVLRAANGRYVTSRPDGTLVADATDPNDALLFIRLIKENPDNAYDSLVGPRLYDARSFSSQIILVNVEPEVFEAKLGDSENAPWVPANGLDANPNLPGHTPHPALRPVSFGVKFYDDTPVREKRSGNGPWDFSWVQFPGPWGWPDGNRLNTSSQLPADCSKCNLRGVFAPHSGLENLSGANLTDADLSTSYMWQANFVGATLARTKLSDSLLRWSNFEGVDLSTSVVRGSDFRGANLKNASLAGCDLKNTAFEPMPFPGRPSIKTNLEGTDFSSTDLNNEPFRNDFLYDGKPVTPFGSVRQFSTNPNNLTKFRNAKLTFDIIKLDWSCLDLTGATIVGLPQDLSRLEASHLTAHQIDLSNRILKNAVFKNADLSSVEENKFANFRGADLTGASFKGASLRSANFSAATLTGANFDGADLTGARFLDADLTGASCVEAKLAGANFSYATLDKANFHAAQLGNLPPHSAANLGHANMRGTDFSNANLDKCNLRGVQWYGPGATGYMASLQDADFTGANLGALLLSQAHLDDATLDNTILIGAHLDGVTAKDAKFNDAHLQGTNFTGAVLDGAKFNDAAVYFDQGVPLFHLTKSKYIHDLRQGVVSDDLRKAFTDAEYDLVDPSVTAKPSGPWTLANVAFVKFRIIQDSHGRLNIYDSSPLFQLDGSSINDLNHGVVSEDLKSKFISAGNPRVHPTVAPNPHGGWTLSITPYEKVTITQDSDGGLFVFPDRSHPLFQLEGSHISDYITNLNKGIVPLSLKSDFLANKHELVGTAWATPDKPGWTLWNDPITMPGSVYANFKITEDSSDDLTVYGADIWVTQVNDNNESQTVIEPMTVATIWDRCTISGETVFPNGQQYAENERQRFTLEMMKAHSPPKPPTCVSTGTDWSCPKNKKRPRV